MNVARALRLCAALLLTAGPSFAAGIEPVTVARLPVPLDGYTLPARMVNDRGDLVGGVVADGFEQGIFWSTLLEPTVMPAVMEGHAVQPDALNERGQVAGTARHDSAYGSDIPMLFLWSPEDGMIELGMLPEGEWISVSAMNNRGAIVGNGHDPSLLSPFDSSGYAWTPEGGYEVLPLPPGGLEGFPYDINDDGLIVGEYERGTDAYDLSFHAALWSPDGSFLEIGTPGEYTSFAKFVNERGQVAGIFSMEYGYSRPFLWSAAAGFQDCGQLVEGDFVDLTGFNDRGHMVGYSYRGGAWFWSPESGLVPIPTLGGGYYSVPQDINNHDQVVGWSWAVNPASGQRERHAFLWSPTTGMQDLGTDGGQMSDALDISDRGRIAGSVGVLEEGWYLREVPVIWTIPDLGPVDLDDEDPIARLIREVTELRDAGGLSHAAATELLQALETAVAFRDGDKGRQGSQAIDRFVAHVGQLAKRGALGDAAAEDWTSLAQDAIALMGGERRR